MKTKYLIGLPVVLLILAGAVLITLDLSNQPVERPVLSHTTASHLKSIRPRARQAAGPEESEAANLTDWQSRYETMLQESASREDAVRSLMSELEVSYGKWVDGRIAALAALPASERYDRLDEIETSVREGAAAILDLLEIDGSRHVAVLQGPLNSLAAEIQYAESASDHESRLALLKLDREREARLLEVLAIEDEPSKAQAMNQLDQWYDTGVGSIFGARK